MSIRKTPQEQNGDYIGSPADDLRELHVPVSLAGSRLDVALASLLPEYSRSRLQAWIREGRVCCNGQTLGEVRHPVRGGETLLVRLADQAATRSDAPEDIALPIVFEDAHIIVIAKPVGLVVHPGNGNASGTLLNALLAHDPALAGLPRAGIVHRLDKDTSGLMVVARTLVAQTDLVRQLQSRSVKRQYLAVVHGEPPASGTVDAPIGRHPVQRTKMAVVESGKPARTHYRVIEHFARTSVVECSLETGRTHQIRVHMAHIGHPLVGDTTYAARRVKIGGFARQALHAFRLGLIHPASGEAMSWEAPPPDDLQTLLVMLRQGNA